MSSAPPPDENPDRTPDEPLPDAEVDRRFQDLIGSLRDAADSPTDGAGPLLDATDTPAVREAFPEQDAAFPVGTPPWPDAGPRDYALDEPDEEDEGYTPPEPDPIEVRDPRRLFAGLLALAPIVYGVIAVFADIWISTPVLILMACCFMAGVVWFMLLLPHDRDPHDPGAVV